jgi:hypothetical protein
MPVMLAVLRPEVSLLRFNVVAALINHHRPTNDPHRLLVRLYWLLDNANGFLVDLH